MSVVITGKSTTDFWVNFQEENGDIGFHMSFRFFFEFIQGVLANLHLNSLKDGKWQEEVAHSNLPDVINEIRVSATEDHFEISINGGRYPDFKYRSKVENIAFLDIGGSFSVQSVAWQ